MSSETLNLWKDELENNIILDKKWYLFNLFEMIDNWFDIRGLCVFDISKNKKEFVVRIMNLIEKWEKCEKVDYILSISDAEKMKMWFIMNDLDLLWGAEKRADKKIINKN